MYRQGDVLIERIDEMPQGLEVVSPTGNLIVLAEGEATGHHHAVAAADVEQAVIDQDSGAMFLRFCRDSVVTHQEHDAIPLPMGTYRVTRQREYTPEEIRRVQD